MPSKGRRTVSLKASTYEKFSELCKKKGVSLSSIVEMLITDWNDAENPVEVQKIDVPAPLVAKNDGSGRPGPRPAQQVMQKRQGGTPCF